MKTVKKSILIILALCSISIIAQEKKIKFNKGTLRICSSKNFQISGYDGNEVIIKSVYGKENLTWGYTVKDKNGKKTSVATTSKSTFPKATTIGRLTNRKGKGTVTYYLNDSEKRKGLKKLGKNVENEDLGIYFIIEQKDGELIFKEKKQNRLFMVRQEKYEVKIPNSLKLVWQTGKCTKDLQLNNQYVFYNSEASSLSDFQGEVEISTKLHNTKLKDVTGPVSVNTIGGNVTIEFDKKKPTKIYSIYSNNGFIDITLPKNSSLNVDAIGKSVFSDLDFKILEEKEIEDFGHVNQRMKLKLNSGSVKMKLNAGYGEVYLRKKK